MLVELVLHTNYNLISKTHQSNYQSAYWSSAYPYIPFLLGLAPNKKYVEQVEKSFLFNEVGMSRYEKKGEQEDA